LRLKLINLANGKMDDLTVRTIEAFRSGLNCAQAVVGAFAEDLGYDRETAHRMAAGFGGGMGRLQATCGVVTGAFMVIGLYNSGLSDENRDRKENSYTMVREFHQKFLEIHGSALCSDLIEVDLMTEEGRKQAHEHRVHQTICENCLATSIRLLEVMVNDQKSK
jgi:C_GCAxxG_C_C family probable redox protein